MKKHNPVCKTAKLITIVDTTKLLKITHSMKHNLVLPISDAFCPVNPNPIVPLNRLEV